MFYFLLSFDTLYEQGRVAGIKDEVELEALTAPLGSVLDCPAVFSRFHSLILFIAPGGDFFLWLKIPYKKKMK